MKPAWNSSLKNSMLSEMYSIKGIHSQFVKDFVSSIQVLFVFAAYMELLVSNWYNQCDTTVMQFLQSYLYMQYVIFIFRYVPLQAPSKPCLYVHISSFEVSFHRTHWLDAYRDTVSSQLFVIRRHFCSSLVYQFTSSPV